MDAETGMAAGAAITVTTKSGTNTFKGSAFEFFNNEKLNATPYYFGRGAAPAKLPVERQTFGGTLGGPILRNQLFFFGVVRGLLQRARTSYAFYSVPDAAMRNGDFSNALNTNGTLQRHLRSDDRRPRHRERPASSSRTTSSRPTGSIRSRGRCWRMYPLPNVEGTGAGDLTNNYRVQQQRHDRSGTTWTSRSTGTARRRTRSGASSAR